MIWVVGAAFVVGIGCGLASIVGLAWLEVWQGYRPREDKYVGLPNVGVVGVSEDESLRRWDAWLREKDAMRIGVTKDQARNLQRKWLTDKGYDQG